MLKLKNSRTHATATLDGPPGLSSAPMRLNHVNPHKPPSFKLNSFSSKAAAALGCEAAQESVEDVVDFLAFDPCASIAIDTPRNGAAHRSMLLSPAPTSLATTSTDIGETLPVVPQLHPSACRICFETGHWGNECPLNGRGKGGHSG